MIDFLKLNSHYIFMILFLLSEIIGESEKIKSNSIYGVIHSFLKGEAKKSQSEVDKLMSDGN